MRTRAAVHVAGPPQSGKTSLVEAMLCSVDESILAARCIRDDSLRRPRESAPRADPELRRYRHAGAAGAGLFKFPGDASAVDEFFSTELMTDYSEAVVLEGDDRWGSRTSRSLSRRRPQAGSASSFDAPRPARTVNVPS